MHYWYKKIFLKKQSLEVQALNPNDLDFKGDNQLEKKVKCVPDGQMKPNPVSEGIIIT